MNIYVASSWRNCYQPGVVRLLRSHGHEVYDFRNPSPEDNGFHWSTIDGDWKQWSPEQYRKALENPIAENGFNNDMNALLNSDVCILVQPCGTSSHLELGWAIGRKLFTCVFFPMDIEPEVPEGHRFDGPCPGCRDWKGCLLPSKLEKVEPELMAKMADTILINSDELIKWLEVKQG